MNANSPAYAIGQAVFIRTDTVDYVEEVVPFKTLEEMVQVCSQSRAGLILDKVVVYALAEGQPCALTLGFVAATKGQRQPDLEAEPE